MPRLLFLAIRNILRNHRRSALTAGGVLFGVAAILVLRGLTLGLIDVFALNYAEGRVGALDIHKKGFLQAETQQLDFDLPLDEALIAKIRAVPGVKAVTWRITFDGMIGNGVQNTMTTVVALDPARELEVCPSRWKNFRVTGLTGRTANEAVVGRHLTEALGVERGGTLVLLAPSKGGASNALDLSVSDTIGTGTPFDTKRMAIVPVAWAQELLGMQGRVTEYAVAIERLSEVDEVAAGVRAALGPEYEVRTWREALPFLRLAMTAVAAALAIVAAVLFLLVITGIINTMLMSVYERVREIGTMLAVGVRRREVVTLFLLEALVLGLAGGIAGTALGVGLVSWLHAVGIAFKPPGGEVATMLRPWLPAWFVVTAIVVSALGALVGALYPAYRASKLTPVEALRSV